MNSTNEDCAYQQATEQAKHCIQDNPATAVLGALAIGAFVGVLASRKLSQPSASQRRLASGLGDKLMQSLEKSLPEAVSSTLGIHR